VVRLRGEQKASVFSPEHLFLRREQPPKTHDVLLCQEVKEMDVGHVRS
jgi:hypothetical protein